MMHIFIAAILLASAQALSPGRPKTGEIDIFPYIIQSLKELKMREMDKDLIAASDVQYASSVCYEELGCFDKEGTFKHLKQLPEPPETVNTQFLLYTRKNPDLPQFMDYKKPETVKNSNINPKAPLKFLTHGFGGKNNLTWIWEMKKALLDHEDLNVIIVDWSLGARIPYYIAAAVNTELVGAQTAVLYYLIKDTFGIQEKNLHVIGFSLGAQVGGFVGKRMMELRGTRPGRITGLDPASPLFEDYGEEVHLHKENADFVDIVHTNADLLLYGGVGMRKDVGHVDYYPNGGKRQPGCGSTIGGAFIDIFKGDNAKVCNHERSVLLYIDSIRRETKCIFTGYKCNNYTDFENAKCLSCEMTCGEMGYRAKGSGPYYLMTKETSPYCTDLNKLSVEFSKDVKKSYGALVLTLVGPQGNKENITITEKDDKLLPGDEKVLVITLGNKFLPLKEVTALYMKYNGWLAKGTDTFVLSSVSIINTDGKHVFKTCSEEILLNDNEYQTLKSC